jgi:uncharacterized protein YecT (DUF1311 family)
MILRTSLVISLLLTTASLPAEPKYSKDYSLCMNRSQGITVEMRRCTAEEHLRHDKRLNSVYAQLMRDLPKDRADQLRKVQLLWISFRDANCNFYNDPYGGTAHQVMAGSCGLQMTAERADELTGFQTSMIMNPQLSK